MRINKLIIAWTLYLFNLSIFAQTSDLRTYGYFDLEAEISNRNTEGKRGTFDQHHFNIVSVFTLDKNFRIYGEIEWEHGAVIEGGGESTGKVVLEKSWVEYKRTDAFKIKLGKFLPPFGIYNLKHDATPTFLPVFLPSSLYGTHENTVGSKQRLYAKFGTGIQFLGSYFTRDWETNYYLYLINGRGPRPHERDSNANKGFGGRLSVSPPMAGLTIGLSYYSEINGNAQDTRQSTLAFDASLERADFFLEAEFFLPQLEEVDIDSIPTGDFRQGNGYYVQGAYTFRDRFTPFVRYDFYDPDMDGKSDNEQDIVLGINYSVTSRVYLKSEVHQVSFQESSDDNYEMFVAAIVVAF